MDPSKGSDAYQAGIAAEKRKRRQAKEDQDLPKGDFTGRCGKCGSSDLWEDNLTYGCNSCGEIFVRT